MVVYVLLGILLLLSVVNTIILAGVGMFLLKLAGALQKNRDNVAASIEDITDMIRMIRGNFEDLKNFIRSLV